MNVDEATLDSVAIARPEKRIAAIVLPRLLVEVVERSREVRDPSIPLAVLLDDDAPLGAAALEPAALPIAAIDEAARATGVRVGQTVAEATAFAARLEVARVDRKRVLAALRAVAEIALVFGPTAQAASAHAVGSMVGATSAKHARRPSELPLDTVWVDVSGTAHLFGGEEALALEIEERLRSLGHLAYVAIADGPRIAQALARHQGLPGVARIAAKGCGREAMAPLPIRALLRDAPSTMPTRASRKTSAEAKRRAARAPGKKGLDDDHHALFVRLGVFTVGDFAKLPHTEITSRLGASAGEVLMLAMGLDPTPLEPFRAPDVLVEETSFEDGVELAGQLLFVVKGMASRLAARLGGRAQATNRVELCIRYDRSIFALRSHDHEGDPLLVHTIDLPAPLSSEADLFRTLKAKLDRIELAAPAVAMSVTLSRIVAAPRVQLDLSRDVSVSPDALPALLSELAADIGETRVGVLAALDSHKPEARSALVPPGSLSGRERREARAGLDPLASASERAEPTRLFATPVPIGAIEPGSTIFVGRTAFEIAGIEFHHRLEAVEWWTRAPASRDYLNVLLTNAPRARGSFGPFVGRADANGPSLDEVVTGAWVYVDRKTGEAYLQGLWE